MRTQKSEGQARSILRTRLEARRPEIEQTALTRVNAIDDLSAAADPAYVEGLRGAVAAALDYGLLAIETGDEQAPPIPVALLGQARVAARNGVGLDTVLRRYFAGYSLLGYFLIEEASRDGLIGGAELQRLLGRQANLFDLLLAAVGEEHQRESELRPLSSEQRQAERIERLLDGELIDTSDIGYDFGGWHVGAIASGPGADGMLRGLARALDLRVLLVSRGDEKTVWAWLGARRRPNLSDVMSLAAASWVDGMLLAIAEPASGLSGWRLTHRQAAAALPVAQRGPEPIVGYADVALLASVLQDDVLSTSLRQLYLAPLERERDGGAAARATLGAFFAAGRNVSSAAAALGVSQRTVTNRLRGIEERLAHPLRTKTIEIEAALRLDEFERAAANTDPY